VELIPGRKIFYERTELDKPLNRLLALVTIGVTLAAIALFFVVFDGWFIGATLVSTATVVMIGQLMVGMLITARAKFKVRWGNRAFSIAFRFLALPGLTFIGAAIGHFAWIEGARIVPREIALALMAYLLVSGIVLWWRAITTFGLDNLSLMYVYFPSESCLVQANVYSVLRHPVYSAVLRIAFALALQNGSAFALFAGCVAPIAMMLWLRWAEEPELIERFGEGYRDYRRRVPAFFNFDPRTWGTLWQFLIVGK
jgi:protein-S-isoprenylcysteine O-methyltransferase Ste14